METRKQIVATLGQDCCANPAAYAAWGLYRSATRRIDYGFVIGAYYRKTKPVSHAGETRNVREFYTLDLGGGNQIVPMPLATVTLDIPLAADWGLGLDVGSNLFVTHVVAAVSFDLGAAGSRNSQCSIPDTIVVPAR